MCSYSKHHTAAQQTLYEQLLHEHQKRQQQWQRQQVVVEEDDDSDVTGDDVTSRESRLVADIREFDAAKAVTRKLSLEVALRPL